MRTFAICLLLLAVSAGAALAQAPVVDPGWEAFIIRNATAAPNNPPVIQNDNTYVADALEFIITESGQKAGLGTDLINGARISQIATLHIDRLDDVPTSGSLYGPYFNIWVTDGLGNYAVLANEPSDAEWAGSRWDVPSWDFLKTKRCKVYEVTGASGGQPGTSWVATYTGKSTDLIFEDVADLVISPPPPAYIADPLNGVGSGAPDEIGTNVARGYNWIFGDTLANYVTGADGFIVANYSATAPLPVNNTTQGTSYGTIQAALDAANPGDAITVAAGRYEEQLHVTVDGVSVTGAGVGVTFIDSPASLALSYTSSAANYPVVFVDGVDGVDFADLTLDGLGRGNANYRFQGIAYYNAGGSLTDVHVTGVIDTPFSGAQHGVGVMCYADDALGHVFAMTDVLVDDFQKSAVVVAGAGVTGNLVRVTTTGAGPTGVTAQNGIQASSDAYVAANDCDVSGMAYTGGSWAASGVLSSSGAIADLDGCTIDGCQASAYFSDGGGSFDNGAVTNPLGDALYAYSSGAKAAGNPDRPAAQPFDSGASASKAAISVSIDGSVFTGAGAVDSWGPSAYGSGPVTFTMTNSTVTNWDYGVVLYDLGGLDVDASGSGNAIAGNLSMGAWSNAVALADFRGNDWGDASGPYNEFMNAAGLGNAADGVLFTPWTGRTTTVVASLGIDPTSRNLADDGYGYWEGTPALGLDDDYAAGFTPGALQANVTAADAAKYTKYGFVPSVVFGRDVYVAELYSISYFTRKDTSHLADPGDWFCQFYTNGTAHGWYGNRINAEPYFSADLTETPGEWTQWVTEEGADNRLRFFDSNIDLGGYDDGFLVDLANDPVYGVETIMLMGLGTGTAWAEGFTGKVDGLTVELVSGETATFNFISGNAQAAATPATGDPLNCSGSRTLTFGIELDEFAPDVFLYNAVVRATGPVDFGTITDLLPFGTVNNNFFKMNNGDGSWTITGSTVGNPTSPVTGPGTADLFSIQFLATAEGTADITFDSLVLRDPLNNTIPVVTSGATIDVDCTAPAAVTGITAAPGHNKVDVSWSHDGTDVVDYEVYRGLWYWLPSGDSAYPEYDDYFADVIPTRPADRDAAAGSAYWELAGTVTVGTNVFVDEGPFTAGRGVYYYEVFPVDAATNYGPAAAANDRATNYWLGDVTGAFGNPTPNGLVDVSDMNDFSLSFGKIEGDAQYNNIMDVGPTDDWSRLGIPLTDNVVNFEDLIIFAMNFGVVSSAKTTAPVATSVDLAWVAYDDGTMALRLVDGSGLKGLRVTADAAVAAVTAGALLDQQDELTFLKNVGAKLDASVAVMGVNTTFAGTGDLLVVRADEAIDLGRLTITARAIDNSELKVKLTSENDTATPRVFALYGNYPNPFNPMTKISFSLPASQAVRLEVYGVDGRRVATLVDEVRAAGLHEVLWTGRDDVGRSVASGTYFYRLNAGPHSAVGKMTLMK